MKLAKLVFILFLLLPLRLSAQSSEAFFDNLSKGWTMGNSGLLAQLLDDEVDIASNGTEKSYSRDEATAELTRFFGNHRPANFNLKHKGTSADGQLYLIGQLNLKGGGSYRIICRARNWQSGYRIFKMDLVGSH